MAGDPDAKQLAIVALINAAYTRGRADAEADTAARIAQARREERERCLEAVRKVQERLNEEAKRGSYGTVYAIQHCIDGAEECAAAICALPDPTAAPSQEEV